MSIKVMSKAWDLENITAVQKLLLMALADYSDDNGFCYPSQETLAKKTGLTRRSVYPNLQQLEDMGLIKKTYRSKENGGRLSLLYDLLFYSQRVVSSHPSNENLAYSQREALSPKPLENHKNIKVNQKDSPCERLIKEYASGNEMKEATRGILEDFYRYRLDIKKTIKTVAPFIAYIGTLKEIQEAHIQIHDAINLMKEKEWQTLKAEWVVKELASQTPIKKWNPYE